MGAAILILFSYLHLDVNSYLPTYRINRNDPQSLVFTFLLSGDP